MVQHPRFATLLFLLAPAFGTAQRYYTYIGQIDADSVLLAWGAAEGDGNAIGRNSVPHGQAEVHIDGRKITESQRNWVRVGDLSPDHEYPYEVYLNSGKIGWGRVRTYPTEADKLAFFVIGDWGNGSQPQYEVAEAMHKALQERARSDNPVRFVLTTGDNIYANRIFGIIRTKSGDKDRHWAEKFFEPYKELLRSIPFYPTLGNHDGDESESREDLAVYLDNFFFPAPEPSRFYSFNFGGLADFFAIDSTGIETQDGSPIYELDGKQYRWLEQALSNSRAPWKIPYFHHPPFNAGPGHGSSLKRLRHFVSLFAKSGVKVAFNGHEHNFQWSKKNAETLGVRYVISGAGGELRSADVSGNFEAANIEAWAPEYHFLLVEISGRTMNIGVLGPRPVVVRDRQGKPKAQPLEVTL